MESTNFDRSAQYLYTDQKGYAKPEVLDLATFRNSDGSAIAAAGAGIVGFGAVGTNGMGLIWDPAADANDVVLRPGTLPPTFAQYADGTCDRGRIIARVRARKVDAGSNPENATLALSMIARFNSPAFNDNGVEIDGGSSVATVTVSQTLGSKVAAATVSALRYYYFDFTAAMTPAQRRALFGGAKFDLSLGLSGAPGTGLSVEVWSVELFMPQNLTPAKKFIRRLPWF